MKKKKQKDKRKLVFGFVSTEDKEYFIENFAMLLASGMDILDALNSIKQEVRSAKMKSVIADIENDIAGGSPIWKALAEVRILPEVIISLIRIGEKSGRLVENLRVIVIQQKKERIFRSKIRSAMLYPVFVLALAFVIGLGIAWFILPKLTVVFSQLKMDLPLFTRILISFGNFINNYGTIFIPASIFMMVLLGYIIFFLQRTKFIGQAIVFRIPGVKKLIQETELGRMGYILGNLLKAGLPIVEALNSLEEATYFYSYRHFYGFLRSRVEEGNSLQKSFGLYKNCRKLIPAPVQQIIVAGEQSGSLPEALIGIGENFEEKTESTTKNLAVILEPILLVVVWLGVVFIALAVIMPIYNLIGGLNQPAPANQPAPLPPPIEEVTVPAENSLPSDDADSGGETDIIKKVRILSNGLGYLNVRDLPSTRGKIIGKVKPGEEYVLKTEQAGWFEIILAEGQAGWISRQYAEVLDAVPEASAL